MNSAPSYWLETCTNGTDDLTPRASLPGDVEADVAIVGAGYTGLWTAHHLLRNDPSLRVVVVEREIAGWGASGRNGGWCSALFATSWSRVAREYGPAAALAMRRALERTVDEVGAWCSEYGVDAHYARGGTLTLARGAAQVERVRAEVEEDRRRGGDETTWLDSSTAAERLAATGVDGAAWTPHCAAVHPARLARGLARVAESQGAQIFEQTPVIELRPHVVMTDRGTIRADVVVRATEGYTADLPGTHRDLVPLWSFVIATEPIDAETWASIGWGNRETLTDGRHLIIYAQRTADGRIVFGGRGAPYRWGSRTTPTVSQHATFSRLEEELRWLLPQVKDVAVTHRWGGVLGVSRDWRPAVVFDRRDGLAWAGGYVGDGVGCAALAGRTLADLILERKTDETALPWVGHRWRRWEPEPLRWLGIHGMTGVMARADAVEARTGRQAASAAFVQRFAGH